jgi:iron complex transport system substrate-binding protein
MSMAEIDAAVSRQLSSGKSLYHVHEARLRIAAPDLLLTQNLCQVCGPAGTEVSEVLRTMDSAPKVIWQNPRSFEEVVAAIRALGKETETEEIANTWAAWATSRVQRISTMSSALRRVRVSFLEWIDPVYCGGHWVPQMLKWAGAEDRNSRIGTDSVRIPWEQVLDYQPEVIIAAPCGFNTCKALDQAKLLQSRPGWHDLPAVRHGKVYAVDANSYFARPGPRLVDGVALLVHLIHREYFDWTGPANAYAPVLSTPERRAAHH